MVRLTVLLTAFFLLSHTACAGAEPIGRLFFSPAERAKFDQMRNTNTLDYTQIGQTPSEQVTLNGIVRRSGGKTTAWVNQMPQRENEMQPVTVLKSTAKSPVVPLQLPSGKQIRLKPGQTFDTTKGQVREGYEDTAAPLPAEALK